MTKDKKQVRGVDLSEGDTVFLGEVAFLLEKDERSALFIPKFAVSAVNQDDSGVVLIISGCIAFYPEHLYTVLNREGETQVGS